MLTTNDSSLLKDVLTSFILASPVTMQIRFIDSLETPDIESSHVTIASRHLTTIKHLRATP
ncbi:hypothetical protein XI09_19260 [Bradyrhizobium sp. CCBAU 11386]|nr:hypothetical protein [Bradyrhizobium sp. CCBAU 11386]